MGRENLRLSANLNNDASRSYQEGTPRRLFEDVQGEGMEATFDVQ